MSWSARKWAMIVGTPDEPAQLARLVAARGAQGTVPHLFGLADGVAALDATGFVQHPKIRASARHVLLVLAELEREQKGYAWPTMRKLADITGLDPDTVQTAIRSLETGGLIEVRRREGRDDRGHKLGNHYRLCVPEQVRQKDQTWDASLASGQAWDLEA